MVRESKFNYHYNHERIVCLYTTVDSVKFTLVIPLCSTVHNFYYNICKL